MYSIKNHVIKDKSFLINNYLKQLIILKNILIKNIFFIINKEKCSKYVLYLFYWSEQVKHMWISLQTHEDPQQAVTQ